MQQEENGTLKEGTKQLMLARSPQGSGWASGITRVQPDRGEGEQRNSRAGEGHTLGKSGAETGKWRTDLQGRGL